jgi:hypothetical protein
VPRRSWFVLVLIALALPAVAQTTGAGDNLLTQDEREAGFRLLFDGKSLDGWEGGDCWSVEDGMIVGRNDATAPTNYLFTTDTYGDFVLRASCRLEGGNSGIQYRTQRRDADGEAIGYQADMDDVREPGAHSWWGCLYEAGGRGVMIDGWTGLAETVVRMGDWNECEIICQGTHIIQRVNGLTTIDIQDTAASEGRFALQVHAGLTMAAYFRNIRVRPLTPDEPLPAAEPGVPAGWTPLFSGSDLANFDVMGAPEAYSVQDGILRSEGGKGGDWLRSKQQYADFVLHVEWRVSPGGNAGVFIRSAPEGAPWETGQECQISNEQPPRDELHCTGTLYGNVAANPRPDETPEVWRTYEIHCVGPRITVIVDDTRTVDVDAREVDAIRDKPLAGYVGLQDSHTAAGYWIEYRNVRIKELRRPEGA